MSWNVYVRQGDEWVLWCTEMSYADACNEVDYLRRHEGIEAQVA